MKKAITILLSAILVWNVVLTTQLSTSTQKISNLEKQIADVTVDSSDVSVIESDAADIEDVVNNVSPAVVTITTSKQGTDLATGSGVVYARKGNEIWLVTNNHVINGGDGYTVLFTNHQEVKATLVGADEFSDLAVLKAKIDFDLDPVTMGDSATLQSGQTVLAIGSPAGESFAGTVTKGIISGVDRVLPVDLNGDGIEDWDMVLLQTDAAINPGNSGGALVNLNGELIGINTIKIAAAAYEGMGFAIPVNEVINIVSQLEANGEVKRPTLGVSVFSLSDVNEVTRQMFGIKVDSGLYVNEVLNDSPADEAGIQAHDIIIKLNDEPIESFKQFRRILYSLSAGDQLQVEILRGDETLNLTVTL